MKTVTSTPDNARTLQTRIVSGTLILLSGSGLTAAVNLAYNMAVARFLGPIGFGQATAVYTLLTLVSAVTLAYQLMAAKAVAQGGDAPGFERSAWIAGGSIAIALLLFRGAIADYLHLPGTALVVLLAGASAFYVPLGSRRGVVQGAYGFRSLAANLLIEGLIRFGGSVLLASLGYGVHGVIAANVAAVAAAYLVIRPKSTSSKPTSPDAGRPAPLRLRRELAQAFVFFGGQVLINNCDIVLVKHFIPPTAAGLYAVVAMVGRVIFALCQAVVNSMVPVVAATGDAERKGLRLMRTSLGLVLAIGAALTLGLRFAPVGLWSLLFGARFLLAGFPGLLALYAAVTVLYALSSVVITYEMSYKIANMSWVQLVFSFLIVGGIYRFHSSLREVILVQLVLVSLMLLTVAAPFMGESLRRNRKPGGEEPAESSVRLLRRVNESEVIAEFLQSEFGKPAFRKRHRGLEPLVYEPELRNEGDNRKRRALLFTRHMALWSELPPDTVWYEAELGTAEWLNVRVFPRAHWRRIAGGDRSLGRVAESLAAARAGSLGGLPAKIDAIRRRCADPSVALGSILLIGSGQCSPLVILDGNHRSVAAALEGQTAKLRILCGLSPDMVRCCWYRTSFSTLLRYGVHLLRQMLRSPEAELAALLAGPRSAVPPGSHVPSEV